ncbi:MAG: hypothetical protein HY508_15635 [Acidobacteria bacterium]|nr:hypothetical protein [Acidobacteriota bacterium]
MAWIDPLREPMPRGGKLLIECGRCSGVLILASDGMGRVTIEAPRVDSLLSDFSSWLDEAAAATGLTTEAVATEIGKPWLKTDAAGCPHCLAVRPEPYVKGLNHVASSDGLDELYQCPKCSAYRWKTIETHGFAEVEVWGRATRDDLRQFKWYLDEESKRRGIPQEEVIEEIFQHCV